MTQTAENMQTSVQVEHHDRIVTIRLNQPERKNALSSTMLQALSTALTEAEQSEITSLILTGAGGCFCAGADLTELTGTTDDLEVDNAIETVVNKIREFPVPVIAAIDGPCMGGAVDLALSCDVRIAASNTFFQLPATRLSLLYNPGAVERMYHSFGRDTMMRLLIIGERFDAKAALSVGMVSHIVEEAECYEAAFTYCQQATGNSRSAMTSTKNLLNALAINSYDADYWEKQRLQHLSSPERLAAVSKAKSRFTKK